MDNQNHTSLRTKLASRGNTIAVTMIVASITGLSGGLGDQVPHSIYEWLIGGAVIITLGRYLRDTVIALFAKRIEHTLELNIPDQSDQVTDTDFARQRDLRDGAGE